MKNFDKKWLLVLVLVLVAAAVILTVLGIKTYEAHQTARAAKKAADAAPCQVVRFAPSDTSSQIVSKAVDVMRDNGRLGTTLVDLDNLKSAAAVLDTKRPGNDGAVQVCATALHVYKVGDEYI